MDHPDGEEGIAPAPDPGFDHARGCSLGFGQTRAHGMASEVQKPDPSSTCRLEPMQLGWDELEGATNAARWLQNPYLKHR